MEAQAVEGGVMGVDDVVLPAIGVSTQVGQFLTPDGVTHGMLLEVHYQTPGGHESSITFAVSSPGVTIVKQAIDEYHRNLRKVLAGELEPTVIQAEAP